MASIFVHSTSKFLIHSLCDNISTQFQRCAAIQLSVMQDFLSEHNLKMTCGMAGYSSYRNLVYQI